MRRNEFIDLAFGLKYLFNSHGLCLPNVLAEISNVVSDANVQKVRVNKC
ncbi:MAG: hypothetical protein JWR67_3924 [Mucilaginibacter sp.]|nr:hypothetical protein [Mucilaginibacter sp.]